MGLIERLLDGVYYWFLFVGAIVALFYLFSCLFGLCWLMIAGCINVFFFFGVVGVGLVGCWLIEICGLLWFTRLRCCML